jgi:hypothetical protein
MFWGWADGAPRVGCVADVTLGRGGHGGESTSESLEWNTIFVDASKCVGIPYRCALCLEYSSRRVANRRYLRSLHHHHHQKVTIFSFQ